MKEKVWHLKLHLEWVRRRFIFYSSRFSVQLDCGRCRGLGVRLCRAAPVRAQLQGQCSGWAYAAKVRSISLCCSATESTCRKQPNNFHFNIEKMSMSGDSSCCLILEMMMTIRPRVIRSPCASIPSPFRFGACKLLSV